MSTILKVSPSTALGTSANTSSSPFTKPLMYGVVAACSVIIVAFVIAVSVTVLVACHNKHHLKQIKMEGGDDHYMGRVVDELDRVSIWSIRSFSSLNEDLNPGKKVTENMKRVG